MIIVHSYDRKTGDPISWHECCEALVEIDRKEPDCNHMFACKCRTVVTLQCPKCKQTCTERL